MLHASSGASEEQRLILRTVRDFVEREVIPVASEMEHRGEYPHALANQMAQIGLFGLNVPTEEFGGTQVDYVTFARIFTELSRGWLGLAGIVGTHLVLCDVVVGRFGSDELKRRFLPGLAAGERRGGICLSESNAGTDLQNISTTAARDGAVYRVNGSKMWITNARHGNTFLLLAKTDPKSETLAHRGMSAFVIEKGAPEPDRQPRHRQTGIQDRAGNLRAAFSGFRGPGGKSDRGRGRRRLRPGDDRARSGKESMLRREGLGIAEAAFDEAIRYAQRDG